jgi:predicted membrane protein
MSDNEVTVIVVCVWALVALIILGVGARLRVSGQSGGRG